MDLNYKKSLLIESMGYNIVLPTFYGKKAHNIKLTESQFKRLVESYIEDEDLTLAEMNFGDGDLPLDDPEFAKKGGSFQDDDSDPALNDSINEFDDPGEFNPGDGADDESYDGDDFEHDIVSYDPDLTKKSREDKIYEDIDLSENIDSHLKNLKKYMNNK